MEANKNQGIIHKLKELTIKRNGIAQKPIGQCILTLFYVLGLGETKADESEYLPS